MDYALKSWAVMTFFTTGCKIFKDTLRKNVLNVNYMSIQKHRYLYGKQDFSGKSVYPKCISNIQQWLFAKINRSDFFLISYLRKKIHIKIFQSKFVLFSQWPRKFIPFFIIFNPFVPIYLNAFTVQNIVFSPNFVVWKFCGNTVSAKLQVNRGKIRLL